MPTAEDFPITTRGNSRIRTLTPKPAPSTSRSRSNATISATPAAPVAAAVVSPQDEPGQFAANAYDASELKSNSMQKRSSRSDATGGRDYGQLMAIVVLQALFFLWVSWAQDVFYAMKWTA